MDVTRFATPEALAEGAADFIVERINRSQDRFNLGLAGGSTPAATYEQLRFRSIEWAGVDVWLSDERWVPHDSPESNGAMAYERFLHLAEGVNFLRPRYSERVEPDESATYYEASLRHVIPDGRPDLILLGMGTDGHTASLFPGTAALKMTDSTRWFVSNHVESLDAWRLTVTPYLLDRAQEIAVIVAGTAKAAVLAEAIEHPAGRYPIEILHDSDAVVTFLVDEAAGAQLE